MEQKIIIEALIKFDSIRIVAAYKTKKIVFIHNEEINLSKKTSSAVIKKNIKDIFQKIENKTNSKVNKINIIFDDLMKKSECLEISTRILEEFSEFGNNQVLSSRDFENIIQKMVTKAKESETSKQLISVIPFKFIFNIFNSNVENCSESFPIGLNVSKIKSIFSIRYMDKESYSRIVEYFDSLNIEIENIALETQTLIYENKESNSSKIDFSLVIKDNKSILISSENDIVIKTDELNYSFENLVKKIADNFSISSYEAEKLINSYGKVELKENEGNEIIYSSSLSNTYTPIKKEDLTNIIKSFLKSICQQANEIICSRFNESFIENSEIKLLGQLSKIQNVENYCSKYFENINVISISNKENIFSWNENYISAANYCNYIEMINNKLNPETFYYNNNDDYNRSNNLKRKHLIDASKKQKALLA